jgi:tetratricopeptide (TPR) repeat protein
LYLLVPAPLTAQDGRPAPQVPVLAANDPDALYGQRERLELAREAAAIWADRTKDGRSFEAAWKLARASYWIGTHAPDGERRAALEQGVKAGEQAATLEADRPEGHFWMAANMGALAESFGLMQGLKYRGRIKDALEKVLKMDPGWQQGSADRALGRWYFKVPGLFGGSREKAEMHLRRALGYNPRSTATLVFLAEVLIKEKRADEARGLLQQAIDAPVDPDWAPEDRDFKKLARTLIETLR